MQKVGFIGLGLMGGPMAANVARAGYPLTVYNRTVAKAEALRELGAQVASSPQGVAEASDVVITMLSDETAVRSVLYGETGLLAGAREGMLLIDMSTVAPEQSRRISTDLEARGLKMLDVPVMGSTGPAKEGTLGLLVGGDRGVFEAQRELLGVMGQNIFYMGPQGSGAMMKLSMNLLVAAQITSLAEAIVLAVKGGLDLDQVGQIIASSGMASNLVERKVGNIVDNNYQPAFPLTHIHKDLGLMVHTAATLGAALPVTSVVHQLYTAAKEGGHADKDSAAIYCLLAEMAGLES